MRNQSILYCILLLFGATACHESVDPNAYTADPNQARTWVVGQWTLERLLTMSGNTSVPDLKVIFDQTGQMIVLENGKPVDKIQVTINQDAYNVLLEPVIDPALVTSKWYQLKSILTVSKRELRLYVSPSSDSPTYIFRRTRSIL